MPHEVHPRLGSCVKSQFLFRNVPRMYKGTIIHVSDTKITVRFNDNEVHRIPISNYMEFDGEGNNFIAWMYEGDKLTDLDMLKEVQVRAAAVRLMHIHEH